MGSSITPWDVREAGRSAAIASGMLVLAVVVTAFTDEGGVRWGERVARVLPLVPVCVAAAAAVVVAAPNRRGEVRALEALGRSPLGSAAGAAAGAAAVGLLTAAFLGIEGLIPVRAFFPTVHSGGPYVFDAGAFTNVATGWRVARDGTLALPVASAGPLVDLGKGLPLHARLAAAFVTAIGSLAFALTVAEGTRRHPTLAWLSLLATAAATTVCLQGAASGRVPIFLTPVAPTVLLMVVAWAIVRLRWHPKTK